MNPDVVLRHTEFVITCLYTLAIGPRAHESAPKWSPSQQRYLLLLDGPAPATRLLDAASGPSALWPCFIRNSSIVDNKIFSQWD